MTDNEARALGERWVKAGGGWRRGMVGVDGRLCAWDGYLPSDGEVPDLRRGVTRGAALEVVRERLGEPTVHVQHSRGRGWEAIGFSTPVAFFATEGEALLAALEACPKAPTRA